MHFLREPLPWWLGGLLFGGVVVALRATINERVGVLGGYSEVVELARRGERLGWKAYFLAGVVVGGLTYAVVGHERVAASGYGWLSRDFASHQSLAIGIGLTVGGLLIGFGAKTAGGCTSGNGFGGTTSASPASFAATVTFFGAAVAGSFLLRAVFG